MEINHIVEIDFKGFPKFVDALGGVNMTLRELHRLALRGPDAALGAKETSAVKGGRKSTSTARTRSTSCGSARTAATRSESDLTRARRQQQFLEAVKGELISPLTFPRCLGRLERAARDRSDMGGLDAAGALLRLRGLGLAEADHPAPDRSGSEPASGLRSRKTGCS